MILTRSTRLSQPQGPVEISPDFGGRGVVYLPNVQSGIARVAGTVGRLPTQHGISASYSAGEENKIERLNGSSPNGLTEFAQIVYLTPMTGGQVNDRGLFGNRNTTGITSFIQLIHQARDAAANGRYCYRLFYKPTSAAAEVAVRTGNDTAINDAPSVVIASVKNGKLSIYHNGTLQGSAAVTTPSVAGQLDFQLGNYYDNTVARRLSAQIHLGAFLPRGITDAEAFALSDNPWQLFRPVQRRVYFDMGVGGGATGELILAAGNASQLNSGGTGSIELTHELAGSASSQDNAGSAGAMDQALVLVGASSVQANSGSTASLSEVQVSLTGAASAQANAASAGAISQSINLQGGSDIQANTGLVDAIVQAYVLGGASSAQSNLGSTGQIILGDLPEVTEIIGASRVRVGPAQMASAAPRVGTPSLPVAQPRIGTTTLSTRRPGRMTI